MKKIYILAAVIILLICWITYNSIIKFSTTSGHVIDQDQRPLSDVKVKLEYVCHGEPSLTLRTDMQETDSEGKFTFSDEPDLFAFLRKGVCNKMFTISKEGYVFAEKTNYEVGDNREGTVALPFSVYATTENAGVRQLFIRGRAPTPEEWLMKSRELEESCRQDSDAGRVLRTECPYPYLLR